MPKQKVLVYLVIGILAGLLVSACAGTTNSVFTIKGEAASTGITSFTQARTPLTTNIISQTPTDEEVLIATKMEEVELVKSVNAMATTLPAMHHCESGEFAP